jgi:hypothetical protein
MSEAEEIPTTTAGSAKPEVEGEPLCCYYY